MIRRRSVLAAAVAALAALLSPRRVHALQQASRPAPDLDSLWSAFRRRFIQRDGRVIDHGALARSTSEGQAYALFHALVLGDAPTFERLLEWTRNNLCGGNLTFRLPAWEWGRHRDGRWAVLDANNATDADLLICYCLAESRSRLGGPDRRRELDAMMAHLASSCLRETRAWGPVLLPAARGFENGPRLRLNPSYLMLPVLARLAKLNPDSPWPELASGARRLLLAAAQPHRLARDWIEIDANDPDGRITGPSTGSYDAIRVYLWAGLAADEPLARSYRGLLDVLKPGSVPERIDADRRTVAGLAPPLMSAALLPWLSLLRSHRLLAAYRSSMLAALSRDASLQQTGYYEANLALYAEGWWQRRYRFLPDGRMRTESAA